MSRLTHLDELAALRGPVALAIGVFDGLHRGHQEVVRAAAEHAHQHDGTAVLMTFDPHPAAVLSPGREPPRLSSLAHRQKLAAGLGARHLLALPFDHAMAATDAEDFVDRLAASCALGCVSVGYTWTFGRDRAGNVHQLMDAGARHGFAVYGVPPVREGERVVSSTWLREAVRAGDLDTARRLLGRAFGYLGRVAQGRQLGRQLDFPTANVALETEVHPPPGVYACRVEVEGVWLPAVCNLGHRPTVENEGCLTLEAHLLDWSGDLYGREIEVRLEARLRDEQRFDGIEALRAAIRKDASNARDFLSTLQDMT